MEKYRRWTDQAAGINPFVAANVQSPSFLSSTLSAVVLLAKGSLMIALLPILLLFILVPIGFLRKGAAFVLLMLMGVYGWEDFSLGKADGNGKSSIILSNHTCFIDALFFIYRFPQSVFLGFNEDKQGNITYHTLTPFKVILSLFTSLQIFYRISQNRGYSTLNEVFNGCSLLRNGGKLIIFYQKIRTNGKGTIRMDKALAEQLYALQKDIIATQIKYTNKKDALFSLTTSPLSVLSAALGSLLPGNTLKMRATKLQHKGIHSANELRECVNTSATGALLDTSAKSYFQFIDFYRKTQRQGYKLDE